MAEQDDPRMRRMVRDAAMGRIEEEIAVVQKEVAACAERLTLLSVRLHNLHEVLSEQHPNPGAAMTPLCAAEEESGARGD
jgi:hypothetical protein